MWPAGDTPGTICQKGVCPEPGTGVGRCVSWARDRGKQASRQNLVLKIQHATLEYDFVWES